MKRPNPFCHAVMSELMASGRKGDAFVQFITQMQQDATMVMPELERYMAMVDGSLEIFEKMAAQEELLLMMKARWSGLPQLKLSVVRNYIYTRHPFYRRDHDAKDIRVIAGTTEVWGRNLLRLRKNETFMAVCKRALEKAMDKCIQERLSKMDPLEGPARAAA